jgi:hypothetical protein
MINHESSKNDAPGQNKEFTIFVNTREKKFTGKEISYEQVVAYALNGSPLPENIIYTVTFSKGEDKKPKGSLSAGDSIHVKEGMEFTATPTTKS